MSFRTTGVLAVILIALAAFWYVYDYKGEKVREEKARLAKRILRFDENRVHRLTLATGDTVVICQRAPDGGWTIVSPVNAEADRGSVDMLVKDLAETEKKETVEEYAPPAQLELFGLTNPSFWIFPEGVEADTLMAGNPMPVGGLTYVKLAGNSEVLAVPAWAVSRIRKTLFDLRDKTAVPFDRDRVSRIEILHPGGEEVLARSEGDWRLERPAADEADGEAVGRLLWNLSGSKVRAYESEAPADVRRFGLDPPSITITLVEGEEQSRKTLDFGEVTGAWRYARYRGRPAVFAVDTSFANIVAAGSRYYRSKKIAHFNRAQVRRIEFMRPDSTVVAERDTSMNWRLIRPPDRTAEPGQMENLLSSLEDLKSKRIAAESLGSPGEYGFDDPALTVRLTGQERHILTLTLSKERGSQLYGHTDLQPVVYEFHKDVLDKLWPKMQDLESGPAGGSR